MASTITNYSLSIDTQFPVPGQDNDTQGFRNNFGNIQNALTAASSEITDLQVTNIGIINQINTITKPTNIAVVIVTATTIISENITNSGNITNIGNATVSGNITTNGKFIGDGSLITNIPFSNVTSVGTLTNLSVDKTISLGTGTNKGTDKVEVSVSKDKLLIDGASSIKFITTETVSKSLVDIDLSNPLGYVSTLTLNNVTGLEVGYTFQFFGTETNIHIVNSINTLTNKITTDPYNHNEIQDYGYGGVGNTLTFKIARTNDIIELQSQLNSNTNAISKLSNVFTTTKIDIISSSVQDATTATLTAENNRLLLKGVGGITLVGQDVVTANLLSYSGSGPNLFINTLTLDTVTGIDIGYSFKLYSTETSYHTVLSINTVTNSITTDPFDPAVAQDNGVNPGDVITFTQGILLGTVSYASTTPTVPNGKSTDKKGHIYADTSSIYLCYSDYINASTPIWKQINTSDIDQLRINAVSTGTRLVTLETQAGSTGTRITNLETRATNLETRATNLELKRAYYADAAPSSSKGQPGDKRGTVFSNSSFIYICIADYTTGTADIWNRTTVTNGGAW